jgi:hypothetical protein
MVAVVGASCSGSSSESELTALEKACIDAGAWAAVVLADSGNLAKASQSRGDGPDMPRTAEAIADQAREVRATQISQGIPTMATNLQAANLLLLDNFINIMEGFANSKAPSISQQDLIDAEQAWDAAMEALKQECGWTEPGDPFNPPAETTVTSSSG